MFKGEAGDGDCWCRDLTERRISRLTARGLTTVRGRGFRGVPEKTYLYLKLTLLGQYLLKENFQSKGRESFRRGLRTERCHLEARKNLLARVGRKSNLWGKTFYGAYGEGGGSSYS